MAPKVAVTAGRRRDEQVLLLERAGVEAVLFPLVRTDREDCEVVKERTEDICAHPPAYLVANTGYGMRTWFELARSWGLLESLVGALGLSAIAARGAKALGELRKVGLKAFYRAPGETLEEVAGRLMEEDLAGKEVAVQLHGEEPGPSLGALAAAGAQVSYISVYKTASASEVGAAALVRAVVEGRVDAVTFTAAPQVQVLFAAAGDNARALAQAFNSGVLAACVGPVCAQAARALGIAEPLVPPHPRLGSLVTALTERLGVNPKSPLSS